MNTYAKLINGQPEWAPNIIKTDGYTVSNPGPDILLPLGYKEVIYDERPEPEEPPKSYRPVYTEETDRIRVSWEEYTPDPEPTPDPEQLREEAYRAEADQYLLAYEGYLVEGRTQEAEQQKTLYLAAKAKIRERYPDDNTK